MSIPVYSYFVVFCRITSPLCPVQWLLTVVILHPELRWCRPLLLLMTATAGATDRSATPRVICCLPWDLESNLKCPNRLHAYAFVYIYIFIYTYIYTHNTDISIHLFSIHLQIIYIYICIHQCIHSIYLNTTSLLVDGFDHQIFNTGSLFSWRFSCKYVMLNKKKVQSFLRTMNTM